MEGTILPQFSKPEFGLDDFLKFLSGHNATLSFEDLKKPSGSKVMRIRIEREGGRYDAMLAFDQELITMAHVGLSAQAESLVRNIERDRPGLRVR
jgi:hypothetical protein